MPDDTLASLLEPIPAPGQTETGAVVIPDKKSKDEASLWKDQIKKTQHKILTYSLWYAFAVTIVIVAARGLHLILPEQPRILFLFGFRVIRIASWLNDKQLSAIDHLLVSGAFVAALGAGQTMLQKASPYDG